MRQEIKQRIEQIKNGEVPQGYKKTKIGIVPNEWEVESYKKYIKICSGRDQKEVVCEYGKYPILGTGGKIGSTNNYLYDKPSVLIGRKGTIDKPQYMDTPFWTVDTLFYSKIFDCAIPKFIYYKFCFVNWYKYNEASGVPSLNSSTIENIITSIPSLNEQQKISEILSTQDKVIELKEKLLKEKEKQKKYLMQILLMGRKRLKGFNGEWKKYNFENIFRVIASNKYQIKKNEYLVEGVYPVIDQGKKEIVGYSNNEEKVLKCPQEGIIVFGDHTCCLKFIDFDFIVGADGTQLLSSKSDEFLNIFLYYYLSNKKIINDGYSRHFKYIKEFVYTLPKFEEQKAIAEILTTADKELKLLQEELEEEKRKKKALMQLLLTGIVRVKV